jgi:hypothetical protein
MRTFALAAQLVAEEGKAMPAKLLPPPVQPMIDVGVVAGHLHLLLGLQADDRLVEQHVVEHAEPRAYLVSADPGGDLDRLGDGDAERAGAVGVAARMARPAAVSSLGLATTRAPQVSIRRGGRASGVADLHHVDLAPRGRRGAPAKASDEPHWPAPVSVARRFTPSCLL